MELHAEGIEKRYFRNMAGRNWFHAVCPTDLTLQPGQVTVLMGRSGSGKTTLLQMLAGLLAPSAGQILVDGQNLYAMSDAELSRFRNGHIAVIPQGQSAVGSLTVLDNVLLPCTLYGKAKQARGEASAWLTRFGIGQLAEVYPSALSGGELRRMAVVRALLQQADILLADEPTSDLDDENSLLVLTALKEYAKSGKAVLLVTHELSAQEFADQVWQMSAGKIDISSSKSEAIPETRI